MSNHIKRLEGKKFGRLFVQYLEGIRGVSKHAYWSCLCDCGKKTIVRGSHLISKNILSCGCYAKEVSSQWLKKYTSSVKHQGSGNPQWKGNKASYSSKHRWLNIYFQKNICMHCKSKKHLQWALKKGKMHAHKRKNYIVLCSSCHLKYDYTKKRAMHIGQVLLQARIKKQIERNMQKSLL